MTTLVAVKNSKKIAFNTHDYSLRGLKNENGVPAPGDRLISVGFYNKVKIYKMRGKKMNVDKVLTHHFISANNGAGFEQVPYSGKTLMISIRKNDFVNVHKEATEDDKIKYKEAYQDFLLTEKEKEDKQLSLSLPKKTKKNINESQIEDNQNDSIANSD